jgi:CheY-specific phosphatase CheX
MPAKGGSLQRPAQISSPDFSALGHRMAPADAYLQEVMAVIERRSISYAANHLDLNVRNVVRHGCLEKGLRLRDLTAMVALGPHIDLYIAYSFDNALADLIMQRATEGLGISAEEEETYRHEATSEMVNIIVGNSTADLAAQGRILRLSPPVVMDGAKKIQPHAEATIACVTFQFDEGEMDVAFVGPRDSFDTELNFKAQ